MKRPVAVVGAGAVGPWGLGRRGASTYHDVPRPSRQLHVSHPGVVGFEIPELLPNQDAGDGRQRKLMSQGARLGAIAIRDALLEARWTEGREGTGCFMGVGASGAHMEELPAVLEGSLQDRRFSEAAFGERGLYACNPLFVFQLMHNFSLCHGAILAGIGGPNGAYYSRGGGTWTALEEAIAALEESSCSRVLAGGTDSAHHAVTWAEFRGEGVVDSGLVPSEGAAVLALEREADAPLAWITSVGGGVMAEPPAPDAVFLSAWNPTLLGSLEEALGQHHPGIPVHHGRFGEALAAGPALTWMAGLDLLEQGYDSVLVVAQGVDGQAGHLCLRRHL